MEAVPGAKISITFKITTAPSEKCDGVEVLFCKQEDFSCTNEEEVKQSDCVFTIEGTADKDSFIKRYGTYNAIARFDSYKEVSEEFIVNKKEIALEGAFNLSAKVTVHVSNIYVSMCEGSKVIISNAEDHYEEEIQLDEECTASGDFELAPN